MQEQDKRDTTMRATLILGEVKKGVETSTKFSIFEFAPITDYGAGKPT
jgi:hypothetical protein